METIQISGLSYWPIRVDSLRLDSTLDFELYVRNGPEMTLYRAASEPFTEEIKARLIENGVATLYTTPSQQAAYQRYVEKHLSEILTDANLSLELKSSVAYDTSKMLVRDILAKPTLGENIQRGQDLVASSVEFILGDERAFANLMKVMSFDYSTYTHSVNVCTFSIALAKFLGINDETSLNILGVGALLHDVGKTRIPEEILNRKGPLEEDEFELIKKHPLFGQEIVMESDLVHQESYIPIVQHHEREDGSGYPYGLKSEDIHEYSKIVAVVDVFDAMTTQRSYRNAVETFPALMVMYGDGELYDKGILEKFTLLMGPKKMIDN